MTRKASSELLLEFRPNSTNPLHRDVFLFLEGYSCTCDSYYFAIDHNMEKDCEDEGKAKRVMRSLLLAWKAAVTSTNEHSTVFLPFDFSDEYTGCLRCTRKQDGLEITPGWSRIEGHQVAPNNPADYFTGVEDFDQGHGWAQEWSVGDFVAKIDESIAALNAD